MTYPAGDSLLPATDIATYCFPLLLYVHGVEEAKPGRVVSHSNLPVTLSKAWNFLSREPPRNTSPPRVTIGPGEPVEPVIGSPFFCNSGIFPTGMIHSYSPVLRLMALSVPHGGLIAGRSSGSFSWA